MEAAAGYDAMGQVASTAQKVEEPKTKGAVNKEQVLDSDMSLA